MNDTPEIQRLTKAISNLATVLIQSTAAAIRAQSPPAAPAPVPSTPAPLALARQETVVADVFNQRVRPWMDKKDVAAQLKVSVRTIDNMVRDRRLPYFKI